jgi:hypothetical protein
MLLNSIVEAVRKKRQSTGFISTISKLPSIMCRIVAHKTPLKRIFAIPVDIVNTAWISKTSYNDQFGNSAPEP